MYRKSTELPNRTQEQLNLPNVVRVKPTMSDISGTCDRPLSWLKGGIHYVKPQSNRKCNQQHIPRVLHILTGEYYQKPTSQLTYPPFVFWRHPDGDLRRGAEHCTSPAHRATLYHNAEQQICQHTMPGQFKAGNLWANFWPANYGPI